MERKIFSRAGAAAWLTGLCRDSCVCLKRSLVPDAPSKLRRKEIAMRRRIYYLLPNLASARRAMDDLLLGRVEERHIHFVAKAGTPMDGLHEASVLQNRIWSVAPKSDSCSALCLVSGPVRYLSSWCKTLAGKSLSSLGRQLQSHCSERGLRAWSGRLSPVHVCGSSNRWLRKA